MSATSDARGETAALLVGAIMPKMTRRFDRTGGLVMGRKAPNRADRSNRIYRRILAVICRIPVGRVATYGQIAKLVGLVAGARQVGFALRRCSGEKEVPWHRVVNARGEISLRSDPTSEEAQRLLLERELVEFDESGRVALDRFRWDGRTGSASKTRAQGGRRRTGMN